MSIRKSHKMTNIHKFCDDRLYVYKQSTTRNWYARFFAEGKYKVRSLGTSSLNEAKELAKDWYNELKLNKKIIGTPIHGIKIKDVLKPFDQYQRTQVKSGELRKGQYEDYKDKINGKMGKYFKNFVLQDIQLPQLIEFKTHRINEDGVGGSTVQHDYVALNQILKYCKTQGIIKQLPVLPEKTKKERKDKYNPRPWFNDKEWKLLKKTSLKRCKEGRSWRIREDREQLHDFMIWMVNTGMRVQETLRIRFCDVTIKAKAKGKKTPFETVIEVDGKTGDRVARGLIGSVRSFQRICKRYPDHKQKDFLFPKKHGDGLKQLLLSCDLKFDKKGKERNAKSFRSTYIMKRLIARQPIKEIEDNCGTSSDVITKFYAKYITTTMYGDSFTDLPSDDDGDE
jgi:integrase